jgi:hypothetical protein
VIVLGLVLGAYEGATSVGTWRSADSTWWGGYGEQSRLYLTALAGWGYGLSGIEQAVAEHRKWQPPPIPATSGTGEDGGGEESQR